MVSIEVLRSSPYFGGAGGEALKAVAAVAAEREFHAGDVLFKEGDPAQAMYILQQGEIDIVYQMHIGGGRVVDTVVGGDLIGWSALVEPHLCTATAVARANGRALRIDARGIRDLCERDHTLGYGLLKQLTGVLSRRLQGALVQLAASG